MKMNELQAWAAAMDAAGDLLVTVGHDALWGSASNPARALARLVGFSDEEAAEASGLPVEAFSEPDLLGRADQVERGLGRLAAALLCKWRGDLRAQTLGPGWDRLEPPIEAAMCVGLMVANNRALYRARVAAAEVATVKVKVRTGCGAGVGAAAGL